MDALKISYIPYTDKTIKVDKSTGLHDSRNIQGTANEGETVRASISSEALQHYMKEKFGGSYDEVSHLDFETLKMLEKGSLIGPIRQEGQIEVQVKPFMEGTVEHFIFNMLDGKAENPQQLAQELGDMIFSQWDEDVKTRAINREAGMKLAEYIAQNYLDDPEEAQSFLEGINQFAERSEMRDKGYLVFYNSDIGPIKPKANPLKLYAQKYLGYSDQDWADPTKLSAILKAYTKDMANHTSRLTGLNEAIKESDEAFAAKERIVQATIDEVKNAMGKAVKDNLLSSLYPEQSAKWNSVLGLFKAKG